MSVQCDICAAEMVQTDQLFVCKNCGQSWGYQEGRGWSCTILKHLWPKMDENSKMFREEYLPASAARLNHLDDLNLAAGVKSAEQVAESKAKTQQAIKDWYSLHPLPQVQQKVTKSLSTRIRAFFCRF